LPKEPVKINISERDDIADLLALIPPWFVGAIFWVGISELVLKRLYPDDFIKLQAAIIAADAAGDMPPGVAMVAVMYNTLYLVEVTEGVKLDIIKFGTKILEFFNIPIGFPFPEK
jgi:hypothetical protein